MNADNSRLSNFTEGTAIAGKAISLHIARGDGKSLDVWLPVDELTDFIGFLCSLAARVADELDLRPPQPGDRLNLVPLQTLWTGFAGGQVPGTTALVIKTPAAMLAFQLDSSQLAAIAKNIPPVAAALSADSSGPPQ